MRIGICSDLLNAPLAAAAGFDYIEGAMTSVAQSSVDDFERMKDAVARSGIHAEALNVMLPGSFRLTGPDADLKPVQEYLIKGFDRAARLGVKIQVFGSGAARNVPEDWPMEQAMEQLGAFLRLAAPLAQAHGIQIAVEPLNPGECNIINTVEDALLLVKRVNLPNVGALADWFHMSAQDEGVGGLLSAGNVLFHCHIANLEGRRFPLPGDGADFSAFFNALKRIGYEGRVSVEGNGNPDEYASAFLRLRGCL